jgi:hypothetical protein
VEAMYQHRLYSLKKAAECQRALLLATDAQQIQALVALRDLWLTLAGQVRALSEDQLEDKLSILEQIHPIALAFGRSTTH